MTTERPEPPLTGDERQMLRVFLDYHRATLTFGVGAVAMYFASHTRGFRTLPLLIAIAALGFAVIALIPSLPAALVGFCIAAVGLMASVPIFWSLAASRLSGKAAGTAIAIVNSMGAVGGFAGPYTMGWLRDATHTYTAGLWAIAICLALGAVLVLVDARSSPAPVLASAGQR